MYPTMSMSQALLVATAAYGWYATYHAVRQDRRERLQNQDSSSDNDNADGDHNGNDTSEQQPELCQICHDKPVVLSCSDDNSPHSFCDDCFNAYAQTCFEIGGSYSRRIEGGNNNTDSVEGKLPCPFFQHGDCTCHAFEDRILRQHLSDQGFVMWQAVVIRMAVAEAERQQQQQQDNIQNAENADILNHIKTAVTDVLSIGSAMICPRCNLRGVKDDQCMHIDCAACECHWCYCCGRERNPRCQTCEYEHGIFLENHPAFAGHSLVGESAGDGARHEFHRRRQAYFVRIVKVIVEEYDANLWNEFRHADSTILTDVPTPGRQIEWEDLDDASAPLLGRTREDDLQWIVHVDPYINALKRRLDEWFEWREEEEHQEQETPRESLAEPPVADEELLQLLDQLLAHQENGEDIGDELINDILEQLGTDENPVPPGDREIVNDAEQEDPRIRGILLPPERRRARVFGRNRRRRHRLQLPPEVPRQVGYEV